MADPKLGNFELILTNRQDRTGQTTQHRRTNRKIRGTCTIAPFGGKNDSEELKLKILCSEIKNFGDFELLNVKSI